MSDLIEEVGLDHLEEKKLKYLKQALPWIIGATIFIVICMAISNYRTDKQTARNKEMGDMLIKAMTVAVDDPKAADEALSYLVKEGGKGIGDIAMLEKVAARLRDGGREGVLAELERVAGEASNNLTRSYAKIIWMSIIIDQKNASDHEREVMESNLKSFKNDDIEFFGMAQVLGAFFHAKNNQVEEAKSALQKVIASDNVPLLVKDQAKALLANLNV